MELFAEILSVVGALLLSVSCGVLVEELVFGGLVRLFVAHQHKPGEVAGQTKSQQSKEESWLR